MSNRTNLPPPGKSCIICQKECIFECLKCENCNEYTHITCSALPQHHVVLYYNSRIHHSCENCIKAKLNDKYDQQFAWVTSIIERENGAVAKSSQVNEEIDQELQNNISGANLGNCNNPVPHDKDTVPQVKDTACQPQINDTVPQIKIKVNKICHYYKQTICKYGRDGNNCPYTHPLICPAYQAYGPNPTNGCEKGTECEFYHPMICKSSAEKSECYNRRCRKLHLKGTKRRRPRTSAHSPNYTNQEPHNSNRTFIHPRPKSANSTTQNVVPPVAFTAPMAATETTPISPSTTTNQTATNMLTVPPPMVNQAAVNISPVPLPMSNMPTVTAHTGGQVPQYQSPIHNQPRPNFQMENFLIKQVHLLQMQMNRILGMQPWQQEQTQNWPTQKLPMIHPQGGYPVNLIHP